MAGTLRPDKEFQRFNTAKENTGLYFRFKPRSVAFNLVAWGIVPFSLAYYAYSVEGWRVPKFRSKPILTKEYTPRDSDL